MLRIRDFLNNYRCTSHENGEMVSERSTSFKSSMSETCPVILNALPANSNPPAPSCVDSHAKLNPCPTVWYVFVLTKVQGKGTLALPKNLPRLLITSWQRKDVWKTLFQNKSGGTINPVYLPQTTPEQYKESVNKKTLSITNLAQYFYPAT